MTTMSEPFIIVLVKKYLWEFVLAAVCLTMVHNFFENIGGDNKWVHVAKGVVNGLYASVFFGGAGSYLYGEFGLVAGILVGTLIGIGGAKEFAERIFKKEEKQLNSKPE